MQELIESILARLDTYGFKSDMAIPLLGSIFIVLTLVVVILCQKHDEKKEERPENADDREERVQLL